MNRRHFLKSSVLGAAGVWLSASLSKTLAASLPKMKITKVRYYESPLSRPMANQSMHIVVVETDAGITGIGEGGYVDGIRECAEMVIGEDPSRIDHCWQLMMRGRFYPAGREKLHAIGAIDMALWDIKGKALGVPVWQLLGGQSREYIECYSTGAIRVPGGVKENAKATIEAGFRAFRTSVVDPGNNEAFISQRMVRKSFEHCQQIRDAIGPDADWAIDYHTRLDFPDAVRLSTLLEPLEPYFCEDLIRSENNAVYRELRKQVKVPIAVGEQHGTRWDINELIEQHLIDYNRVSIPNCGGITEYVKLAAMCETHYVGLIPHFTGPVSEAALAHVCASFSGPVMMEIAGVYKVDNIDYLPKSFDFKNGKIWPNERPGLGVEFDASKLKLTAEFTKRNHPITTFRRPDGSITNW
ncbi:MAG: mandelate racemase/muconate lactonizing enzyme family protein [Acidobacteria bacterium]|nr:mandelate racemase/muconate lactonizing enzyme family protein [Acidobacteriota bacterium]